MPRISAPALSALAGLATLALLAAAPARALVAAVDPGADATLAQLQRDMRARLGSDHGGAVALLGWNASPGPANQCSGTMITAYLLLTASHCLEQATRRPDIPAPDRKQVNGLTLEYSSLGAASGWAVAAGAEAPFVWQHGRPAPSAQATAFGVIESYARLNYFTEFDLAVAFVRPAPLASGQEGFVVPTVATLDDGQRVFPLIDPNAHAGVTGKVGAVVRGYNANPWYTNTITNLRNEGVFTFLDPGLHQEPGDPNLAQAGPFWRTDKLAVDRAANLPILPPADTGGVPVYNPLWQQGAGYTQGGDSGGALIAADVLNRPVLIGVTSYSSTTRTYWTPVGVHRSFIDQAMAAFALFPFLDRGMMADNPVFATDVSDDGAFRISRFAVSPDLGFPYLAVGGGSPRHHLYLDGGATFWGLELPDGVPVGLALYTERNNALEDVAYTLDASAGFLTFAQPVDNLLLLGTGLGDALGTLTLGLGLSPAASLGADALDAPTDTLLRLRWVTPSVAVVPEPATVALWLCGLLVVGARRAALLRGAQG